MILRKPYAIMIKYFKIIHLIILACLIYIEYSYSGIGSLVNTLINSRTYTYAGADVYINMSVFIFMGAALLLSGAVFWLLRAKNKPTGLYIFLLIYLVLNVVATIYFYSVLNTLISNNVEADTLSLIRDLLFIIRLPGYFLIVMCLIRGIGFNIKQFNFSKDIEELKIAEKDSEEFEVMVGQNNYKYMRFIRRTIRELRYYILENTLAIMGVIAVLVIVLGYFGVRYYFQFMKKIENQQVTSINGIDYVVNHAYETTEDFNGERIKDGYKYVVLNMSFNNTTNADKKLDIDTISLVNKQIHYYPTLSYNSKFYDIGVGYDKDEVLHTREMIDRLVVFEIPDTTNTDGFVLRIEYGITSKSSKIISNYIQFDLNIINIDTEDKQNEVNLNEKISTNVNNENKYDITINGYKIQENYNSRYVICNRKLECQSFNTLITANNYNKMTMMIVDYKSTMYDDAVFTQSFNTNNKVLSNYAYVEYILNNRIYFEKVNIVPNSDIEDKAFFLVDRRILEATSIKLHFKFRNNSYVVPLK